IGSGYYDGINYGLFYSDWILGRTIEKLVLEAKRLNAKYILIGECGHASRSAKCFVPVFGRKNQLPVINCMEFALDNLRTGKLKLRPDAIREKVTYHDPCNIARSGWIVEQPREILRSFVPDFVEMTPNGRHNYCCGGGGGTVSIDEIHDFRMKIAGQKKVDQLRATGADIVVSPCANCKKQLGELISHHKLDMKCQGLHDLLLQAIEF
ncbi:(Fe-S)-binding protein, partial [bacterium]